MGNWDASGSRDLRRGGGGAGRDDWKGGNGGGGGGAGRDDWKGGGGCWDRGEGGSAWGTWGILREYSYAFVS